MSTPLPISARLPGRVLVVDDEEPLREIVSTRLSFLAEEVQVAADGAAAWAAIQEDPPDVLVTDLMMPRCTGEELCRLVRAAPFGKSVWLLILTARAGAKRRVEGLDLGADDYLEKPFDLDELAARVRTGLRMRALQRELQSVVRNETIGWVAYALGHEIRNPLAVMMSNAEVQREHADFFASLWKAVSVAVLKLEAHGESREAQALRALVAKAGGMQAVLGDMRDIADTNLRLARRSAAAVAALQRFAEGASGVPTVADPLLLVEDAVRLAFAGADAVPGIEGPTVGELPRVRCVPRDVVLALATALGRTADRRPNAALPQIGIALQGDRVVVRVVGPGDGSSPEALLVPRIADRAPGEQRSGLDVGLAHADVALRAAGAELAVAAAPEGGLAVEVRLPVAP